MIRRVATIGVYGFDPDGFFETLRRAEIDIFLDVRQRRGVRGPKYAFANSQRLQAELARRGIEYLHLKELAPSPELRQLQKTADHLGGESKLLREKLAPTFVEGWEKANAEPFNWDMLAQDLSAFELPVIFCVERSPDACHRSLAARYLAKATGVEVRHLVP